MAKGKKAVKAKRAKWRPVRASSYTHYHKDGSIWAKGKTKGEVMEGYWEWFRKDGSKMRSGHFKKGTQVGQWITFDRAGKPVKITEMK